MCRNIIPLFTAKVGNIRTGAIMSLLGLIDGLTRSLSTSLRCTRYQPTMQNYAARLVCDSLILSSFLKATFKKRGVISQGQFF